MKNRKLSRKILSLMVMALALLMLASTALATDTKAAPQLSPYSITQYGVVLTVDNTTIRTDWNNDGCQLDSCFLTGNSMLRRLRLTFNEAYDLYDYYQSAINASTPDTVLYTNYHRYGNLRNYLSNGTLNYYYSADGAQMLENLKASSEYRNNATVKWLVDTQLASLETYYAPQLRRALAFFCAEPILAHMNLAQLKSMAEIIMATPEYIVFHNTLFGHDCNTVNELMKLGYSLDYVARLYSSQAEQAVKVLWPDYTERMDAYWRINRAW